MNGVQSDNSKEPSWMQQSQKDFSTFKFNQADFVSGKFPVQNENFDFNDNQSNLRIKQKSSNEKGEVGEGAGFQQKFPEEMISKQDDKIRNTQSQNKQIDSADKNNKQNMLSKSDLKINKQRKSSDSIEHPFGMIIKLQGTKPSIKLQSPQSDVSSETEDVFEDALDEKEGFKIPVSNQPNENKKQSVVTNPRLSSIPNQNNTAQKSNSKQENNPFSWDAFPNSQSDPSAFKFDMPVDDKVRFSNISDTPSPFAFDKQFKIVNSQTKDLSNITDKQNNNNNNNNNNNQELLKKIDNYEQQNTDLRVQNNELSKQLLQLKPMLDESHMKNKDMNKEKKQYLDQIEDLSNQVKALKKFEFMFEEERFSKVEVKNELSIESEKCHKFKNTIDRLNNKLSKREREIARLSTDLEYFKKREQDLLNQNDQAQSSLDALKGEIKSLKAKKSSQNIQSYQQAELMKSEQYSNQRMNPALKVLDSRKEQSRYKEEQKFNIQEVKLKDFQSNQNEIDLEEMFCDVPSSDSDKESENNQSQKWEVAKTLYKEMDTPTPEDDTITQKLRKDQNQDYFNGQSLNNNQAYHEIIPVSKSQAITSFANLKQDESNIADFWSFGQGSHDENKTQQEKQNAWKFSTQINQNDSNQPPQGFSLSWGEEEQSNNKNNEQEQYDMFKTAAPVIQKSEKLQIHQDQIQRSETPRKSLIGDIFSMFTSTQVQQQNDLKPKYLIEEKKESPFSYFSSFFTPQVEVETEHPFQNDQKSSIKEQQPISKFEISNKTNTPHKLIEQQKHQIVKTTDLDDLLGFGSSSRSSSRAVYEEQKDIVEIEEHPLLEQNEDNQNQNHSSDNLEEELYDVQMGSPVQEQKQEEKSSFDWFDDINNNDVGIQPTLINKPQVQPANNELDIQESKSNNAQHDNQIQQIKTKVESELEKEPLIKQDLEQIMLNSKQNSQILDESLKKNSGINFDLLFQTIAKDTPRKESFELNNNNPPLVQITEISQNQNKNQIININPIINLDLNPKIDPANDELKYQQQIPQQTQQLLINNNQLLQNIQHSNMGPTNTQIQPQIQNNGFTHMNSNQQAVVNQPEIDQARQQIDYQPQMKIVQPVSRNQSLNNLDIDLNKSQFNTINSQQYHNQQQQEQQKLDPQAMFRIILLGFFRKSLVNNKSVLYEDHHIQIGAVSEYQSSSVNIKLFFGNKKAQLPIEYISFKQMLQAIGFQVTQNKESILRLDHQQQEIIEIKIKIDSFSISIPVYSLSYKLQNTPVNNIPIRLPVVLLKFCQGLPNLDAQTYILKWTTEFGSETEARQSFNIDFTQCKSLTQLKEVLMFGKNSCSFVDGVEQQKNIICGSTQFIHDPQFIALFKITITGNGLNCDITGRSSDRNGGESGKFAKFIMSNILELIALKIN